MVTGTTGPDTPDSLVPSVSYTAPTPSRENVDPAGQNGVGELRQIAVLAAGVRAQVQPGGFQP